MCRVCGVPGHLVLFTGLLARCFVLCVRCPEQLGSCSLVCWLDALWCVWCPGPLGCCSPLCLLGALCCPRSVLGYLALVSVVLARGVVLSMRCLGPPGSQSPVCPLGVLCCVCGVPGHLASVHRCVGLVLDVVCAVSGATWLLLTCVAAWCVVLHGCVACAVSWPLGSCSPVCQLGVLCCVCGVLDHLAPVHRCACSVRCVACVRCPGPPGSCSPVCHLGVLCRVCCVLGHLTPVHWCVGSVLCVVFAVRWATWLLLIGVPAQGVVVRVRCPGPLGWCSPVCWLRVSCCLCGVLGHLAPVHRCLHSVLCVLCAVSWAIWLFFTAVPAWCVVLRAQCSRPLGSCLCCVGSVLCVVCAVSSATRILFTSVPARCVVLHGCIACAVSWATWLLFTGVLAWCVVLRVWRPGPFGSCSPVCPLGVLCCVCGVLGYLAPVHRCPCSVCCVASAVCWASWLIFTGMPARWVLLRAWFPRSLGSCLPMCPLSV